VARLSRSLCPELCPGPSGRKEVRLGDRLGLTWLGDGQWSHQAANSWAETSIERDGLLREPAGQFSPLFAVVDVAGTDQPDDLN